MDAREIMQGLLSTMSKDALVEIALDGLAFGAAILAITEDNWWDEYEMGSELSEYMVEHGLVEA